MDSRASEQRPAQDGPLTLPISAQLPVIIAPPASVTTKTTRMLPTGGSQGEDRQSGNVEGRGLLAAALEMPMFKGAL